MTPPMKLGKPGEETLSENCLNRISRLPDELLSHILSFLPTRCAVSTSILSTRWRYLFTLTACLSFDDTPCFGHPNRNEIIEATRRFKEFVNKVLDLHRTSPIKKFSLQCRGNYDYSDLNRWISTAVQKSVQELHFKLTGQVNRLTDGFYTSETLVSLKIACFDYYVVQIPLSARLPKLKILHLDRIIFFDFKSMERLFSCCEVLEELTLKYCLCEKHGHATHRTGALKVLTIDKCSFMLGTFEIDAPNLAYLTSSSNIGVKIVPSWKDSCSLVKAELTFKHDDDFDTNEDSAGYDRELLRAAAYKTTKLSFEMESFQILLKLADDEQMPDFNSLSRLHLDSCTADSWKYVTSLLDKSPQLETVIFDPGFHCCQCAGRRYLGQCYYVHDHDSPWPSDVLVPFSCHAKVIEVHDFCGHTGSLSLMGHLLRNARVLKKLIVFTTCSFNLEEEMKISNDLLMLPRASVDCCVEINKGSDDDNMPNFYAMSWVELP
ncbi:hypothetical protein RND81_07G143200 [Saponaria officinalis]|uniref:F-box domain-containing protein n=1 Tax=Saponaria officinalis TaxID=3572 RepID=A0AAW1JQU3_SAPOF